MSGTKGDRTKQPLEPTGLNSRAWDAARLAFASEYFGPQTDPDACPYELELELAIRAYLDAVRVDDLADAG
jgi:hypothetical protein